MSKHIRYNHSEKGRAPNERYEHSQKARLRKLRWEVENRVPFNRFPELAVQKEALGELEEYLASGSSLPFYAWLNETYPLPKLSPRGFWLRIAPPLTNCQERLCQNAKTRFQSSHRGFLGRLSDATLP
jgi:hypothetical protein